MPLLAARGTVASRAPKGQAGVRVLCLVPAGTAEFSSPKSDQGSQVLTGHPRGKRAIYISWPAGTNNCYSTSTGVNNVLQAAAEQWHSGCRRCRSAHRDTSRNSDRQPADGAASRGGATRVAPRAAPSPLGSVSSSVVGAGWAASAGQPTGDRQVAAPRMRVRRRAGCAAARTGLRGTQM